MAGYADRMDRFFSDVPGLSSRIGHHIDFPDYEADELIDIAKLMAKEQQYVFSSEAEKAFEEYLAHRMEQPRFANARSVRNALDRLRMRHAIRLWNSATGDGKKLTKGDLVHVPGRGRAQEPGVRRGGGARPRGDPLSDRERVVLARRTSGGFVPYQWTGEEPEGLDDDEVALAYGARWEDDELVTYDMATLRLGVESDQDDYLNDND